MPGSLFEGSSEPYVSKTLMPPQHIFNNPPIIMSTLEKNGFETRFSQISYHKPSKLIVFDDWILCHISIISTITIYTHKYRYSLLQLFCLDQASSQSHSFAPSIEANDSSQPSWQDLILNKSPSIFELPYPVKSRNVM